MLVVIRCKDDGTKGILGIDRPVVLVPAPIVAVELFKIGWVVDVKFVRTDPDDRPCMSSADKVTEFNNRRLTILPVHLCDAKGILSLFDHVVIRLVVASDCGELWAGKFGKRIQVEAVECKSEAVGNRRDCNRLP